MSSGSLWIALIWIFILGSRPVSLWFGGGVPIENVADYIEGSPIDRNVYFFLIVIGLVVLLKRRPNWNEIFATNRWFFIFFVYCGISVIWSDFPYVGFKRWVKDCGNVIMVLLLLTEDDPIQAVRAVLARYSYLALPLSVVFIKYFPDIGRYYNPWTWEYAYGGVALDKNTLGLIAVICGLFLLWDLVELRLAKGGGRDWVDALSRMMLLLIVAWLISLAGSATSLLCIILGTCILLAIRLPIGKRHVQHLGAYSLALAFLIFFLYASPAVLGTLVNMFGRDITFTGRTNLWMDLLAEPINPIVGTGYQSFWLGARAEHMWDLYYFHPNQAHNGFLETYLNGGLIGVWLLMAIIFSAGKRLKQELLIHNNYGSLRFSFFAVTIFSNLTEAIFNKQTIVWLIMIFSCLAYRYTSEPADEYMEQMISGDFNKALSENRPDASVSCSHILNPYGNDQ
jgi:exopolysaccharide production protein ExoQ